MWSRLSKLARDLLLPREDAPCPWCGSRSYVMEEEEEVRPPALFLDDLKREVHEGAVGLVDAVNDAYHFRCTCGDGNDASCKHCDRLMLARKEYADAIEAHFAEHAKVCWGR